MATGNKRLSGVMAVMVSSLLLAVCITSIRDKVAVDTIEWKSLSMFIGGGLFSSLYLFLGLKSIFHRRPKDEDTN